MIKKAAGLTSSLILLVSISGCAENVPADSAPQQTEPTAVCKESHGRAQCNTSAKSWNRLTIILEANLEKHMSMPATNGQQTTKRQHFCRHVLHKR